MTEPGGQQRHKLCFLSTLLSQKVPEKSDAVLRCMIAGQPKPEVTWYKNGQAIDKSGEVSSYEFFENQYVHLLHLSCCTQSDAAIYQVSAKSCLGMICCSASIEVGHVPEDPQGSPDPGYGSATGGTRDPETQEEESAHQTHEEGHPYKAEDSFSPVAPMPADPSPSRCNHSHSLQISASHDLSASTSESPPDAKATRRSAEACHPNSIQAVFPNSNQTPEKQEVHHCRTAHATVSGLLGGGLGDDGSNEVFSSGHPNTKVQKYISFSLPLSEANICASPGDGASVNTQPGAQVSSDSDSDYELCPEITLTCTEEFSDDDLEYLECSDVMTDYSNTLWQRCLQSTDCVFLLESDDEEVEFSECGLGGWEPFLSEMGRGPQVSDDTEPKDAATGFWGYQSQLQEVGVRSSGASRHSHSPLHAGMTLSLGPHQDGTATVTEPGRCPLPTASGAAENDYSGIQGETRDNHEAEEESACDNLLSMGEAATEGDVKPLSGGLDKSGLKQAAGSPAGERSEEKPPGSRRGAPRPSRMRRPGAKGNAKKLPLREGAPEGILHPSPKKPTKQPLTQSRQRETPHAEARAPVWNSHFHAEQCAIPTPAEQDAQTLGPSAHSLPKEGGTSFEGGGMPLSNLFEMNQTPEQSNLQMHIRETFGECHSPSQKPPFSMPAGKASSFTGTTTDFFSNLRETHKESEPLAHPGLESCAQGLQHEDRQSHEGRMPAGPWSEVVDEQSTPESDDENPPPTPPSVGHPQDISTHCREPEALSVASPEPAAPSLALENVHSGSRGREAACGMECFEAGDQGACYDTMEPPVGTPVDKYLPQDICPMDFELTEGQRKVRDLCSLDKTLAVRPHTRGSEPPPSICEGSKHGNSAEAPLLTSPSTQAESLEASEGAVGGYLAEEENSPPILSCIVQDGPEWPSPLSLGGLLETQPSFFENSSLGPLSEGVDERPIISGPDASDAPASHSRFPWELPTALSADSECLRVTREVEDTSPSVTADVPPGKYHAASISEDDFADSAGESSPRAHSEPHFQFPHNEQPSHVIIGSTNECARKLFCLGPSLPGDPGHIPQLLAEEGLYSNSLLPIGNESRGESQTEDRAESGRLQGDFREKGSETEHSLQPQSQHCRASLSAKEFQESLPSTSVMPGEINVEPSGHTPANSREERGLNSDVEMGISTVIETSVEEDGQCLSHVPSLAENLLGEKEHSRLGNWDVGNKVKVIILEASDCELWPVRQVTESEYKEVPGAGAMSPGRDWALSDTLKADASVLEPGPLGVVSWAHSPQAETATAPALDNGRVSRGGDTSGTDTHWNNLPSQCLDHPRLLESSVDPVEAKDSLSGALKPGGREGVNTIRPVKEVNQGKEDRHPAFLNQFLNFPGTLESSVDPINDEDGMERPWGELPEPSESLLKGLREGSESADGNLGQRVEARLAIVQVPHPQVSGEAIPDENRTTQGQGGREQEETRQREHSGAKMEVQPDVWQVPYPGEGGQGTPSAFSMSQMQDGGDRSLGKCALTFPTPPLSGPLAVMSHTPTEAASHHCTGPVPGESEPGGPQYALSESKQRGTVENTCGEHMPTSSDLTHLPCVSSPEGNVTHCLRSHSLEEQKTEMPLTLETKALSSPSSPTLTPVFISREREAERAPELLQDLSQKGSVLGNGKRSREKPSHVATQTGKLLGAEVVRRKQESSGSGHLAEGMKKKILSRVAALRLRLEEKENVRKNSGLLKKIPKLEKSLSCTDERREPKKAPCKREGKAPVLLKKIQAEMSPDCSGNVKLSCQFAEIHEDSTIWWTKDSKSIAQVQRSAGDNSSVSLLVQAGQKDQGLYYCGIMNSYGKVTAEFNLTAEVLKQLSRHMDSKGCEEIEFSQLIFREDFLRDSYFGDRLRGQIATEELHFGEGVHRKAFRSTVMRGLLPVFQPGHACVLKVHNAIAHGTKDNDELIQKNYKLAAQECYVQNTARHYAKIYAAEAQPLEGFGEVPEIIPIFLIHRPQNNIPYATVEEELMGEFVKYSIRDGKEINFLRRDSEAGQKCCTFQHWVYQKTGGCLLVTDMQGVGMKLTDVGIATLAKGYKGFKGNCSMSFIDQFKALHQCNKYCKMLGLKSLQNNSQKPKKPIIGKARVQANSPPVKTPDSGTPAERKAQHP